MRECACEQAQDLKAQIEAIRDRKKRADSENLSLVQSLAQQSIRHCLALETKEEEIRQLKARVEALGWEVADLKGQQKWGK